MVEVLRKGKETVLGFSEKEAMEIGLDQAKEYELSKAKQGIWVLSEGKEKTLGSAEKKKEAQQDKQPDEGEQKIIGHLKKLSLSERVEGIFEKRLSGEELTKFREMLSENKVQKFKLNETYKKAVYQLPETQPQSFDNTEKPIDEYTLEKDGFLVVKNETRAKTLSEELKDRIKEGEIRGTRSFTGEFFIIKSDLLEKSIDKILSAMKQDKQSYLSGISKKTGLTKTLVAIALEFLKEEGQVLEKRKEFYQYIE